MRIVIIRTVYDDQSSRASRPQTGAPEKSAGVAPIRTTSRALLGTARELIIEHEGREYRLRITQQGKLILTA